MEIDEKLKLLGIIPLIDASKLLNYSNESYAMMRHIGFGASEASVLVGINPFKTIDDLRKEKLELTNDPEINYKEVVRKGKDLEDLFMQKASKHFTLNIEKPKIMYKLNKDSRLTVNFDGVTELESHLIPVEIKMCSIYGRKHYNFSKSIAEDVKEEHWRTDIHRFIVMYMTDSLDECGFPPYYYAQLQQQMMFLNAPYGILAVMDDKEWTMHYFITKRNNDMIAEIKLKAIKNQDCLHTEQEIFDMIPKDLKI